MLTHLEVDGFKNLVGFSVDFGPFTCVAGPNSVGKSNLLDAIRFLSLLTDHSITEAALLIRGSGAESGDIRDLFCGRIGARNACPMVPRCVEHESAEAAADIQDVFAGGESQLPTDVLHLVALRFLKGSCSFFPVAAGVHHERIVEPLSIERMSKCVVESRVLFGYRAICI